MKKEQVQILHAKFGKIIEIDYFDRTDARNHSIEDEEVPHRDLKNALMAFKPDMAEAYYSVGHSLADYFTPNEVIITEKKGTFYITIKGKFETAHGDSVNASSGLIELPDDPNEDDGELLLKLETIRTELFKYFWEDKADGKLPFKNENTEEKEQILEEENTATKE